MLLDTLPGNLPDTADASVGGFGATVLSSTQAGDWACAILTLHGITVARRERATAMQAVLSLCDWCDVALAGPHYLAAVKALSVVREQAEALDEPAALVTAPTLGLPDFLQRIVGQLAAEQVITALEELAGRLLDGQEWSQMPLEVPLPCEDAHAQEVVA